MTRPTFYGSSVRTYQVSMGWNEQKSQLSVALVDDPANGDKFQFPFPGTPGYFTHAGLTFAGVVQDYKERRASDGSPTYALVLEDPRDILAGTQVVLAGYNGTASVVPNLLNAFGYWENLVGFDSSQANDSGMPWSKVVTAVTNMTNTFGGTPYGGPLVWKGYSYSVDLSNLPVPPAYYRVSGNHASLIELISQVCEDSGCDYFVELDGFAIKLRVVSRFKQPPLGTISAIANANWGGTVLESQAGLEGRNDVTSSFLVGGAQTTLFLTDALQPFWGYDLSGNPLLGQGSGLFHTMTLNASEVADVLGGAYYATSVAELCLVLSGYDAWSWYLQTARADVYNGIGGLSTYAAMGVTSPLLKNDVVNDAAAQALGAANAVVGTNTKIRLNRLFQFLQKAAGEYMGKKFLVNIPFVLAAVDGETLQYRYSMEPADAGYAPDGSAPLGLSDLNQQTFQTQDGRFTPYVLFSSLAGLDLSTVSPGSAVLDTLGIYVKAQLDNRVLFTPYPSVVMTVDNPIYEQASDGVGDLSVLAGLFNLNIGDLRNVLQRGSIAAAFHPIPHQPDAVAVPLKSNVLTYGPWYVTGAMGKTNYEQDDSLTPWNYGGWANMNAAGAARVASAYTNMTASESGSIRFVGEPTVSLGDVLQLGGPAITGIDVSYGKDGITTEYRFQTYTPRFGVYAKANAERVKRLANTAMQLRRSVRHALSQLNDVVNGSNSQNLQATTDWFASLPTALRRATPHTTFVGHVVSQNGNTRVDVGAETYEEAVAFANAHDPTMFNSTAVMSLSGLLRPFTTQPGGNGNMPGYTSPASGFTLGVNSNFYNPFGAGGDVEVLNWGSTYQGLHAYRRGNDPGTTRPLALRGPLVVSGWGWGVDGSFYPGTSSGYVANVLRRSDLWKTGPVDLLWDPMRGTWTCHDALVGRTNAVIPAGGNGTINVSNGTSLTGWNMAVWNPWSVAVSGNITVLANYVVTANKWAIAAADCGP